MNLLQCRSPSSAILLLFIGAFVYSFPMVDVHFGIRERESLVTSNTVRPKPAVSPPLELWTRFPEGKYRFSLSNLVLVSSKPTSSGCLCVCDYTTGYDNETAEVQRRIRENQHPPDCESGRYFVYGLNNYGMGSDLHTLGKQRAKGQDVVSYVSPNPCDAQLQVLCLVSPWTTSAHYSSIRKRTCDSKYLSFVQSRSQIKLFLLPSPPNTATGAIPLQITATKL